MAAFVFGPQANRLQAWMGQGGHGGVKFTANSPPLDPRLSEHKQEQTEQSGKIILPNSAMLELAHCQIQYPMMFKIWNCKDPRRYTHCGVHEFTAEEGRATVPYWMMQLLGVDQGGLIAVQAAKPPKGSYVKLRPQQKAFTDLHNPRAVLETYLRNFSCLTKGDTIKIHYNQREYDIDIVEVKSWSGPCDVISIVETDVNVDFDRPADMPEEAAAPPAPAPAAAPAAASSSSGGMTFGNTLLDRQSAPPAAAPSSAEAAPAASAAPAVFSGTGRTISGRPASSGPAGAAAEAAQRRAQALGGGGGRTLNGDKVPPPSGATPGQQLKTDSYGRVLKNQGDSSAEPAPAFKAFAGTGRTLS